MIGLMLVHLRDECRITSVLRVEMHEPLTNTYKLVIIQMRRPNEAEVWRALHAACSFHPGVGKIVVAVDEDIDPSNEAAVFWAMCYRMKPHKRFKPIRRTNVRPPREKRITRISVF